MEKEKKLTAILLTALFLISIAIAIPIKQVNASPVELHVGLGQAYTTIQAAINDANQGDMIIVHEGIYNENVVINKSLTIQGTDKENVIIDGTGLSGKGVSVEADYVTIKNLTIRNFKSGNWPWGIELVSASHCVLEDLIVLNCTSGGINLWKGCHNNVVRNNLIKYCDGNGISIYGSDVGCTYNLIEGNTIVDCAFASTDGYRVPAIAAFSGASNNIIKNNVLKQEAYVGKGRGITLWGLTYSGADMPEADNVIHNNTIMNFEVGIYIIGCNPYTGSVNLIRNTTVTQNTVTNNLVGFKQIGFEGGYSPITLHYNNIYDNDDYGALVDITYGTAILNATLNWWGDPSGPHHPTLNPDGLGDEVSDNVDFDPWLTAPITVVSSKAGTDEWLEFPESDVEVYVSGSATVYIATYESNPGASFMGDIGNYIDVYIPDTSGLTELEVRKYYTDEEIEALGLMESSLRMYWWNGTDWLPCSETGVNTAENYIWATVNATTTPSLTDLTGTPFGAAGRVPVGGVILPVDKLSVITPWLLIAAIIASGTILILRKTRP